MEAQGGQLSTKRASSPGAGDDTETDLINERQPDWLYMLNATSHISILLLKQSSVGCLVPSVADLALMQVTIRA